MAGPLHDIRVIDLSTGPAGGIATMVLADFGADVVKVEPPGGDPFRALPSAPMWLRGKRSVTLDLDAAGDRAVLDTLLDSADVVVSTMRPSEAAARGLDSAALAANRPRLVVAELTGFGPTGPYADYPAHEGVVAAKAGRMLHFSGTAPRPGPQFAAVQVATHAASQATITGVLAALAARERTGRGTRVQTSMLQGLMSYDMGGLVQRSLRERDPERWAAPALPTGTMPTVNYQPVLAKDGRWLQLGNLLQHLFDNFLAATDLIDVYGEDGYEGSPASWSEEAREAFRDRMLRRMRERTAEEWMAIFVAQGGVAAHPYQTTQAALDDPDVRDNGHVIATPVPGGVMRQIGPLARLSLTPAEVRTAAPQPGEHTAEVLAERRAPSSALPSAPPPSVHHEHAAPLDGVLVLDFSTIIAAPLACAHLADLGARVIKVETPGGDPWRWMGSGSIGAIKTNAGKESICLDLKRPEGQAIIRALIERAAIVVHNLRPGVPERLGIGYGDAAAINPGIVYVNANGYGLHGPGAHRPATHPIPGAGLGGAWHQAGVMPPDSDDIAVIREGARRLFRANEVNPDPNTSGVIASAAMLGLWTQRRTGRGQQLFVDMMGANAYANADDFFDYPGRAPRPPIDADLHGTGPLNRLYPARTGWVFLAAPLEAEWHALAVSIGLAADARFTTAAARAEHADALTEELAARFLGDDADAWERRLTSAGVGCVRADAMLPADFWYADPHVRANGFVTETVHGRLGAYLRHAGIARAVGAEVHPGPGPYAGEHADAILAELGYDATEIAGLRASGVVWSEPED